MLSGEIFSAVTVATHDVAQSARTYSKRPPAEKWTITALLLALNQPMTQPIYLFFFAVRASGKFLNENEKSNLMWNTMLQ